MNHEAMLLLLNFRAEHGDAGAMEALDYTGTPEGAIQFCYARTAEDFIRRAKLARKAKEKAAPEEIRGSRKV